MKRKFIVSSLVALVLTDITGAMNTQRGWIEQRGFWYYGNGDGTVKTGWIKYNNKWRYLSPNFGWMVTRREMIDGNEYYFDSNGYIYTGWKNIYDYHYDQEYTVYYGKNGVMLTGWQNIDGKTYYFIEDYSYYKRGGAMVKGEHFIDGKWYYFDENGVLKS